MKALSPCFTSVTRSTPPPREQFPRGTHAKNRRNVGAAAILSAICPPPRRRPRRRRRRAKEHAESQYLAHSCLGDGEKSLATINMDCPRSTPSWNGDNCDRHNRWRPELTGLKRPRLGEPFTISSFANLNNFRSVPFRTTLTWRHRT